MRTLKSALLTSALMLSTSAMAQSDGTLEETYARECPQHQDTQICNALRTTMSPAAVQPGPGTFDRQRPPDDFSQAWGDYAMLPGTVWRSVGDGTVHRYSWRFPGEVMLIEICTPSDIVTMVVTRLADMSLNVTAGGQQSVLTFPSSGVAVQESAGNMRATFRFTPTAILTRLETWDQGAWRLAATDERHRVSESEFVDAAAKVLRNQKQLAATWGVLPALAGASWQGEEDVWRIDWLDIEKKMRIQRFRSDGARFETIEFEPDRGSTLKTRKWDYLGRSEFASPVLADGSIFYDETDDAIELIDADTFEWVNGRISGDRFIRSERQARSGARAGANGVFRRMSAEEAIAFDRKALAAEQQQASSSDSGLFGALAMATGAALAGGNAEHVMGAAMKGAELTTDNEMSRNVLAGKGDRMIASGVQSMTQRHAPPNLGVPGSAPRAAGVSLTADASSAASAPLSAVPARRPIYGWCYAINTDGRAVYMSGVGSRNLSVDEQEGWRSAMLTEFRQQISGSYSHAQCDIDDDSDFSYTRGNVEAANPARIPWSPN